MDQISKRDALSEEQVTGHTYRTSRKTPSRKEHNVEDGPEVPLMRALRAMKKFRRQSYRHALLRQGVEDAIYEIESWARRSNEKRERQFLG